MTDVCVPLSSLAECITETQKDIEQNQIHGPLFGHLGDGNFHVVLLVRDDDAPEYIETVVEFNER